VGRAFEKTYQRQKYRSYNVQPFKPSEKALTNKNAKHQEDSRSSERYTIFHALFEAMKDKQKKGKQR
jgi:hypothetical protein